jgi:hypothetical protein
VAKSGSEIAPNLVPILWISQTGRNRGYSQLIHNRLLFGFGGVQKKDTRKKTNCPESIYPF